MSAEETSDEPGLDTDSISLYSKFLGRWIPFHYFDGSERLGTSFSFRGGFALSYELTPDDLDELATLPAIVAWVGAGGDARWPMAGVISSIEQEVVPGGFFYHVAFVSFMWLAAQTVRSRVFQNMDLAGFIREVTAKDLGGKENDGRIKIAIRGDLPLWEYCAQYNESDLAFLQRQLEREGAYYYFVDSVDDGCQIVFADNNDAFGSLAGSETIAFDEREGVTRERFSRVWRVRRMVPRQAILHDYNGANPDSTLFAAHEIVANGVGVSFRYGENFQTVKDGKRLAKLRAEAASMARHVYSAQGNVKGLRPGHRFRLEGANLPSEWPDDEFYVIAVHHRVQSAAANEQRGYSQTVEFAPIAIPYRSSLETQRPHVDGFIHAKIDGDVASTAAPIDDRGRYKVVFPNDLNHVGSGQSSCWLPMAQVSAGDGYGTHTPLHIGVDVLVGHINGDPDRPVIVGSIPSGATHTPIDASNATSSVLRSKGSVIVQIDDDALGGGASRGESSSRSTQQQTAQVRSDPAEDEKTRKQFDLWVRFNVPSNRANAHDQRFVLFSSDETYNKSQTISANQVANDISVDLHYSGLWNDLTYSLRIEYGDGTRRTVFSNEGAKSLNHLSGSSSSEHKTDQGSDGADDNNTDIVEQVTSPTTSNMLIAPAEDEDGDDV